jgi:hypothetical protein
MILLSRDMEQAQGLVRLQQVETAQPRTAMPMWVAEAWLRKPRTIRKRPCSRRLIASSSHRSSSSSNLRVVRTTLHIRTTSTGRLKASSSSEGVDPWATMALASSRRRRKRCSASHPRSAFKETTCLHLA